jgi:hypothetical protein
MVGPIVPVASIESDPLVIFPDDQAIAIMLDLMDPVSTGGHDGRSGRNAGFEQALGHEI